MDLNEDYWDSRYHEKTTGWDVGYISTPIKEYIDQIKDKKLKVFIPGGGNSYEAEYLHDRGFNNVFVVDVAKTPLLNLQKRVPDFPLDHLIQQDFFKLEMEFDLIIEQTFFCALLPGLRPDYVEKMSQLLRRNGKLVGLLFDDPLYTDHPPFGGNKEDYKTLFKPYFEIDIMALCYNSVPERKGKELFIKLIKIEL
jgi:thiopurine S-methyltransferase